MRLHDWPLHLFPSYLHNKWQHRNRPKRPKNHSSIQHNTESRGCLTSQLQWSLTELRFISMPEALLCQSTAASRVGESSVAFRPNQALWRLVQGSVAVWACHFIASAQTQVVLCSSARKPDGGREVGVVRTHTPVFGAVDFFFGFDFLPVLSNCPYSL